MQSRKYKQTTKIAVGKCWQGRFFIQINCRIHEFLKTKKVNYRTLITPGGHTWMNVKNSVLKPHNCSFNKLNTHNEKITLYINRIILTVFFNAAAQRPPAISSPEINPDNTVYIPLLFTNCPKGILRGEFLTSPRAMSKDTSGIWSITVPPVKPDIYPYSFRVDSVQWQIQTTLTYLPTNDSSAALLIFQAIRH